ncbi:MAG: hypothetical protein ACJ8GN_13310 [Longimicrobiaceae bacterium]
MAASIPRTAIPRGEGTLARFARRLARARPVRSIGALEGTPAMVFGMVEDVATDEAGRFFVLDSRYNNVRIHDASGTPVGSFSGPGRGPGELVSPEALERDRQGRIVVADRYNVIKFFAPRGESFALAGAIAVRFVPEDFCLLGDRIYVQGIAAAGMIHAFTAAGTPIRSFGQPYRSANWLVRNQLSDGPIACSEEAGVVVTMFKYLPIVYGYSAEGRLLWASRLEDFRPIRIVEERDERGVPEVGFDGGEPYDLAVSLQGAPQGLVVVQTARYTPESIRNGREPAVFDTYLLSAATGQGVYVGNGLPRISAVSRERVLAGVTDPFPQVRILALPAEEVVP